MPGIEGCPLPCPFADDPETICAAIRLGHPYCRSAHPAMREAVRKVTLQFDGKWVEPEPAPPGKPAPRPARSSPPAEPALPSLARRALNYAGSTIRHVTAGRPQATPELIEARLAICAGTAETPKCDSYRSSDGKCASCGCPGGAKSARLLSICPLGKWPA